MCCHVRRASVSRRRRPQRRLLASPLPVLATLDLSKPSEREVHDFLVRATSKQERMWRLFGMRRLGDVLLCVVRWVNAEDDAKPFSLAEVSLVRLAVCWQSYGTVEDARAELERRCTESAAPSTGLRQDRLRQH